MPSDQSCLFSVLKVVKEAHAKHGLRHGDYQRYRSVATTTSAVMGGEVSKREGCFHVQFKEKGGNSVVSFTDLLP